MRIMFYKLEVFKPSLILKNTDYYLVNSIVNSRFYVTICILLPLCLERGEL